MVLLDFFSIGQMMLIVVLIFLVKRDYSAKNYDSIPIQCMIIYFFSLSLIHKYLPKDFEMAFIFSSFVIGIFACLISSWFYRKRNRFRYWFFLVFAISQGIIILMGILGLIKS